jgi:hypothetical protein
MLLQQLLAPFAGAGAAAAAKRRAAVVRARDELISAVVVDQESPPRGGERRRQRLDAAVAALADAARGESLLDLEKLGPEPYEVVYASGGLPLWRATAELADKLVGGAEQKTKKEGGGGRSAPRASAAAAGGARGNAAAAPNAVVASQQFTPATRALVNRVEYGRFFGLGTLAVSAFGQYEPLFDDEGEEDEEDVTRATRRRRPQRRLLPLPQRVRANVQGGALSLGDREWSLPFIRGQGLFEVLYADERVRVFRSPGPAGTAAISVQMPQAAGATRRGGGGGGGGQRGGRR